MSKARGSPRKFSEKIALLNKKEVEGTAEFDKIIKEVNETTRAPPQAPLTLHQNHIVHQPGHNHQQQLQQQQPKQYYGLPQRSSSFSSWQRGAPQPQPPQNHGQYLAQPIQYNSGLMHQEPLTQDPVYVGQQLQQQQGQRQHPYMIPPARQHQQQTQPFQQLHQHHQGQHVQQRHQLAPDPIDLNDDSVQPTSLGVPNIEIFPIDDNQTYQQVTSTDGHYRRCSNSSISSTRSLPNIANLSMSQMTSCFSAQTSTDQRLMPTVTTTTTTTATTATVNDNQLSPESVAVSNHRNETYTTDEYYNNDEYCSLPAIHEPVPSINRNDINRQSQTSISRDGSWQNVLTSSAPCSAAPTPPMGIVQTSNGYCDRSSNQQPISTSRQRSVQNLLHQDYYPTQMVRANSTNVIDQCPNSDHLVAPCMNNNLSKSSDAYYGYLDGYVVGGGRADDFSNNGHTNDADNFGNTSSNGVNHSPNSLMRSHSGYDLELINTQNVCKQQFLDATQYSFYG